MADDTCSVDGCARKIRTREWCDPHYKRWRRHGDVLPDVPIRGKFSDPAEAFDHRVERNGHDGCWVWNGARSSAGYGRLGDDQYAHRFSYERHIAPIPDGYEIDHLCLNKACVNPSHLEAVEAVENVRRAAGYFDTDPTECVQGHDLEDPYNIYVYPTGSRDEGRIACRECRAESRRKYQEKS